MFFYLLAQSAKVLAGEPGYDHIKEVAAVANFLAEAESGEIDVTEVELINRADPVQNTWRSLLDYVRECPIEEISAIPSTDRSLPLNVKWDCGRYIEIEGKPKWEERHASFWVRRGRVTKIAFGEGEPVIIPPVIRSGNK